MTSEDLCEKVADLCTDAGLDFLFVLDNASSYSVNSESSNHLRRLAVLHEKDLDRTEYELAH